MKTTAKQRFIPNKPIKAGVIYSHTETQNGVSKLYHVKALQDAVIPNFIPTYFENLTPNSWYAKSDVIKEVRLMPGDTVYSMDIGGSWKNTTNTFAWKETIEEIGNPVQYAGFTKVAAIQDTNKVIELELHPFYNSTDSAEVLRSFPRHTAASSAAPAIYPTDIQTSMVYRLKVMSVFNNLLSNMTTTHLLEVYNTIYGIPTVSGGVSRVYVSDIGAERWTFNLPNAIATYLITLTLTDGVLNINVDAE